MNEVSKISKIDWKEIGITAGVTLVTAIVGCTIAVVIAQTLIIPAINKSKEKKAADKEKDAAKK
jgi:cbb3-type cytochrome oxidase subunit 1